MLASERGGVDGVLVGGNARIFRALRLGMDAVVRRRRLGERAVLRGGVVLVAVIVAMTVVIVIMVVLVAVLGGRIAAFARLENLELVFLFGRRSR